MEKTIMTKLNVGCGTDYREGFINIDGSDSLPKVDKIVDISKESLRNHFGENSVDHILANDIIEHQFHWEAVSILRDFLFILKPGATAEIRVPDAEWIIKTWSLTVEQKLVLLFGGQDISQGFNLDMSRSRASFPQFFCHKFGWTAKSMTRELKEVGFVEIQTKRAGTNFVAIARK